MERRIKKYIRQENPIIKGEHLFVVGELACTVLKEVVRGLPVKITPITEEITPSEGRLVVPWTMEQILGDFLSGFFHGELDASPQQNIIPLFRSLTEAELKKYAEIRSLPLPPEAKGTIHELLDQMEAKYPSTRYSLQKSVSTLRAVLQKANLKKVTASDTTHAGKN